MKKVLLSCVALFAAMSMSAEDKVWDFSAIFGLIFPAHGLFFRRL